MEKKSPNSHIRLIKSAAIASVTVAVILILAKAWVWQVTGSVSLEASLVDSLLDGLASIGNLIAVQIAHRPPDHDHRFGHGKLEAIAALIQSLLIFLSGMWVCKEALLRLIYPEALQETLMGMQVMGASILLTTGLLVYQSYVVRHTHSLAISADSAHYRTDLVINMGVLLTLYWGQTYNWLDAASGVVIGIYIVSSCYQIFTKALDILMDRELSDSIRREIWDLVLSHPKVLGLHDLRTRSSGSKEFIQAHVEMDSQISLQEAHDISDEVQDMILRKRPHCEVLIHIDPPH